MKKNKVKLIEDVTIVSIAHKGHAIGKTTEGEAVLVEGGVPGDVVDFAFRRKKKGMKFGSVAKLTKPSPHRVEPVCDHFDLCGGCKWQNLAYDEQVRQKQAEVVNAMTRIGQLEAEIVQPILSAIESYDYRNKMEFTFSSRRWLTIEEIKSEEKIDRRALGFHKPGSFDKIVDVQFCHLQAGKTNDIRNATRDWAMENNIPFFNSLNHEGVMRNLMIRRSSLGQIMVALIAQNMSEQNKSSFQKFIGDQFPSVTTLVFINNTKLNDSYRDCPVEVAFGEGYILEELGNKKFKIDPKSFFQTNTHQAKRLYDVVVEMAELKGGENVFDLYCGVGSIGLYLADQVESLVGIEQIPEAIEDAHFNANLNGVENANFHVGNVEDILDEKFIDNYGTPDLIVTDPPRVGMHENVVHALLKIKCPKIIYVSCNPSTQARDLKLLSSAYDIDQIRPVDMFPQTSHVEAVARLKLKS